ncbi:hypothetical protein AKJ57_04695 [candidate division MSBL1 archaeon SCGC-AAA259A05]|uniref:Uncharacterized protein n=1 Tax=candidate division MSBL1 archaeon SCGC-AAA259A05 TaxID=1698259 RepID=A0A133U6Y0_9EURY|nr:hypothetical protein AKJ57_04695 [candidate division MSBL1 archaeon SCGC-AAA259A05]
MTHKEKKDSTAKWFIFSIIPVLNLYWLWKAAEIVSGHEKRIKERFETIAHNDRKEPTEKWFGIFLVPVILGLVSALSFVGGLVWDVDLLTLGPILGILWIAMIVVGIYVLYKMATSVSGHETSYPEQYEVVGHKEKKDSTAQWVVFGIIPILNLYFLWKMSETISGHEIVYE